METPIWWWQTDRYDHPEPYAEELFAPYLGPRGIALVKAFDNGATTKGWGENEFMVNYQKKRFDSRAVLFSYERGHSAFAFVMRSMQIICIDIDGKNGGFEHAHELLGNIPYTLAETSKSGNGYHLFFSYEDVWDPGKGFQRFKDSIGIVTGVDIRGVGCVYHYPSQRWNNRPIAPLPTWVEEKLQRKEDRKAAQLEQISQLDTLDNVEALMIREELIEQLKKPIPLGKRNNSLFALGSQLLQAKVEDWSELIWNRAKEVGLDDEEIYKLLRNISAYGGSAS